MNNMEKIDSIKCMACINKEYDSIRAKYFCRITGKIIQNEFKEIECDSFNKYTSTAKKLPNNPI